MTDPTDTTTAYDPKDTPAATGCTCGPDCCSGGDACPEGCPPGCCED